MLSQNQRKFSGRSIIYYSLIDLSLPLGPSINELSFVRDLASIYGKNLTVICPKPTMPSELIPDSCGYEHIKLKATKKNWLQFVELRIKGIKTLKSVLNSTDTKKHIIVSRLSILDIPAWSVRNDLLKFNFFIRHSGDGRYESFSQKSIVHRFVAWIAFHINKSVLRNATGIDFLNQKHIQQFEKNLPDIKSYLFIAENGVDTDLFRPGLKSNYPVLEKLKGAEIVFGYFGGYPYSRGGKEAILTLHEARLEGIDAYALIVGDSGDLTTLEQLISQLNLSNCCVLLGKIPYIDIPALMNEIDIGFSILRPVERSESEQKVRQYLSCDKLVVVSSGSNDF